MTALIPLIGTVLALVQNLIVLTLGMKEGAIWYAPLGLAGSFSPNAQHYGLRTSALENSCVLVRR